MFQKVSIILALASVILGSIDFHKCRDDAKSGVYEQCEMECHADGLCYEEVSSEICDCNMDGIFYWTKYTYEVKLETIMIYLDRQMFLKHVNYQNDFQNIDIIEIITEWDNRS